MNSSDIIRKRFENIEKPNSLGTAQTIDTLNRFSSIIRETLDVKDEKDFSTSQSLQEIDTKYQYTYPDEGTDVDTIVDELIVDILPHFKYENTKFFGYIPRSPTNVSILADALVPFFNQFLGAAFASPTANVIEALTIKWIGTLLGYKGNFFGSYTIGGSHANLKGIFTGLVHTLPWDVKELGVLTDVRPVIYCSDQVHLCISKSVKQLGLGMKSLKYIKSNDFLQISLTQLTKQIKRDLENPALLPTMIIANAGSTNSGAIDNLAELRTISDEYSMWLHVDAAYGGFARIADHPVATQLEKLYEADSIAIDTHKWFYTPMEGGLTLVRQESHLYNAYSGKAEYLTDSELQDEYKLIRNFSDYGFALSRRWRGLMVWMNFKFYGVSGIRNLITRNILLADYFRAKIREHDSLKLFKHSQLGIVCFYHPNNKKNSQLFYQFMKEEKFLIGRTTIHEKEVLRISILNENISLQHIDTLLDEINKVLDANHL